MLKERLRTMALSDLLHKWRILGKIYHELEPRIEWWKLTIPQLEQRIKDIENCRRKKTAKKCCSAKAAKKR